MKKWQKAKSEVLINNPTNNPNDWVKEIGNHRYILDLLLSVINVSMKTLEIVVSFPDVKFE